MSRKVDHFTRGRDAYIQGKRCFCHDARISGIARNAWCEGWKHQQRLNGSKALQSEINEAITILKDITAEIRSMP